MMRQWICWPGLLFVCVIAGCGDADAVNNHEKSLIQTVYGLHSDADVTKARQYTLWQGAWLTDDKDEKMRVVRVITTEIDGTAPDMLYRIADHDVKGMALNTAGDAWKTSPIKWGVVTAEEAK